MNGAPTPAHPEEGQANGIVSRALGPLSLLAANVDIEDAEELHSFAIECLTLGFRRAVITLLGGELGTAVCANLDGSDLRSNGEKAPHCSRALVSKWVRRCQRNLGWPSQFAGKQEAGRKARRKPKRKPKQPDYSI